jgi:hypothetical protein
MTPTPQAPSQIAREPGLRRIRVGAVVAVALVVAFGAWLIVRGGGDDGSSARAPESSAATVEQLRGLPGQTGHRIYWAGSPAGFTHELTQTTDGNVYIRYLPSSVPVGTERPEYLTVGTYPRRKAFAELRGLARRPGSVSFEMARGGLAVFSRDRPHSIYVAFPKQDLQVEVYDPSARTARRLVLSGRIRPIE